MSKAEDVFEPENWELVDRYGSKFGGGFGRLEPSEEITYIKFKTEGSYYVDDNVFEYIKEGLRTNKDVVFRKYKNNKVEYKPGMKY